MATEQQTIWRESATLALVAPKKENSGTPGEIDNYDYEILMLTRSQRTAKVTNETVFPGGIFDRKNDESIEWLQYFEEFGIKQEQLKQLVVIEEQRPRILQPQGTGCYDRFFKRTHIWAREISLRLTAIRETFEEVGILLCRTRAQMDFRPLHAPYACYKEDFDKAHWQRLVHNEPQQFLQLCRHLGVVPDLWGLTEWTVWASPAIMRKGYEAAVFVAFLREQPELLAEPSEVQSTMWETPLRLMRMIRASKLFFNPPQFYEISRFLAVPSLQKLHDYAEGRRRDRKGCLMNIPVVYMCTDGTVSVLPGDSFYRADVFTLTDFVRVDKTIEEFHKQAARWHRFENFGHPNAKLMLNFELPNGNLAPATDTWQQLHKL